MSTQKSKKLKIMLFAWTVGLFGRLAVLLLQAVGLIRIEGIQNLRQLLARNEGFLVIHRHPSMRETLIIPLLFVPWALGNWKKVPVVTPDKHNFYDPWWCVFLRPLAIPVPRGDGYGEARALRRVCKTLEHGRIVVIAPEGGRTFNGKEFKLRLPNGYTKIIPAAPEGKVDLSFPIIRRFPRGVCIMHANGIPVLPVWVDSDGWRTRIVFGEPMTFPPHNRQDEKEAQETVNALEDLLLSVSGRPSF